MMLSRSPFGRDGALAPSAPYSGATRGVKYALNAVGEHRSAVSLPSGFD